MTNPIKLESFVASSQSFLLDIIRSSHLRIIFYLFSPKKKIVLTFVLFLSLKLATKKKSHAKNNMPIYRI